MVGFIADRMESQKRATILRTHTQIRSIVVALVAPLLGWGVDQYGIGNAFIMAGIGLFLVGVLLPVLPNEKQTVSS